jgi:hypothetical protein
MDLKARLPGGSVAVVKNVSDDVYSKIMEKMMSMEDDYLNHKNEIDFQISADSVNLTAVLWGILPPPKNTESEVKSTRLLVYIPPYITKKENGEIVTGTPPGYELTVPIRAPKVEFPDKNLWEVEHKTRVTLKERHVVKVDSKEIISVEQVDPGLAPGDIITIFDFSISRSRKKPTKFEEEQGIIHPLEDWKNAKSAKVKKGTSVYFLAEVMKKNFPRIQMLERPSEATFPNNPEVFLRYVADITERQALTSVTEGASLITFPKADDKIYAYEDKNKRCHKVFLPGLTALQWKGPYDEKNEQKIKVNLRAWSDSIRSARIRSHSNWILLAPYIIPVTDFCVMGFIDRTETNKFGINAVSEGATEEDFNLDSTWSFGLCVKAELVVFDMPKFLKQYGLPLSENFVLEYFNGKNSKSQEVFPDYDPMIVHLNEYKEGIPEFLNSQKGKYVFRGVPAGIQFTQAWKSSIEKMSNEEGDSVASKKKAVGACQLSVQNKVFIFAINKASFESYTSGKIPNSEEYFNIVKEKNKTEPINNLQPAITLPGNANNNNNVTTSTDNIKNSSQSSQKDDIEDSSADESDVPASPSKKQKLSPSPLKTAPKQGGKAPSKAKPSTTNQK